MEETKIHENVVEDSIIALLQKQGYEFVTVRELFQKSGIKPQKNVVYMGAKEIR